VVITSADASDGECTNAIPSGAWLSRSGLGPLKESFFVYDPAASHYDHGQKVYKELSDKPCVTPLSAARAAERIFIALYGNEVVSERPWRVTETNGCYLVTGTLPEGFVGGVAQLKLQKANGRVWVHYHGK